MKLVAITLLAMVVMVIWIFEIGKKKSSDYTQ